MVTAIIFAISLIQTDVDVNNGIRYGKIGVEIPSSVFKSQYNIHGFELS